MKSTARRRGPPCRPDLSRATPTVEPEVKALTDAFLQARYSRQEIEEAQAASVRGYWQQIRRALRSRVKRSTKAETDVSGGLNTEENDSP